MDSKPTKKGRGKAVKKEENEEGEELDRNNVNQAKKVRAKRGAIKHESPHEEVKDENEGAAVEVKPTKKPRVQKAVKREEAEETPDVDLAETGDSADGKLAAAETEFVKPKKSRKAEKAQVQSMLSRLVDSLL